MTRSEWGFVLAMLAIFACGVTVVVVAADLRDRPAFQQQMPPQ